MREVDQRHLLGVELDGFPVTPPDRTAGSPMLEGRA